MSHSGDPERRQYICILRPARLGMVTEGPTEQEKAVVGEHFAYLTDLAQRGQVILFGRTQTTDEDTFGISIFEADSDETARTLVNADPAVRAGVMTARFWPYRVAGARSPITK
jgi:uncharacterized protein